MTIFDQLARDEGCRLKSYRDTKGLWTIGIGRCLETNPLTDEEKQYLLDRQPDRDMNIDNMSISIEEAHYLFQHDVAKSDADVTKALPWAASLDGVRQAVLLNMCFNVGIHKLLTFVKMLAALKVGDWEFAAEEMLNSKYAKDVGDRAKRLAMQLITGEWQ
jgi:lysozyme